MSTPSKDAPKTEGTGPRKAALTFIFITVLIDVLAFGLIIPVLPHLVEDLVGGDTGEAARWTGIFSTTFAIIQLGTSPIQGALSDRFGRRPVILASCFGLGADFVLMALAQSLPVLLLGRVLSAITSASFTTANAYIADVAPPEERAKSFGMLGAAFGLGFVLGPALGGYLGHIDPRAPFWFAAVLALLNFVYGLFVLPESLPPERRAKHLEARELNPLGSLVVLRRYPSVWGLATMIFVYNLAHYVYPSVFVLFAEARFGWLSAEVGTFLAATGVASIVVQGWLVGRASKSLGDRRTILLGSLAGTLGFALYGLAPTPGWLYAALVVDSLWGLASPPTQSIVTSHVADADQGRMQGALSSLASLSGIVAPTLYTEVFRATLHTQPGAPFFVASALVGVAGLLGLRYARPHTTTARPAADPATDPATAPATAPSDCSATDTIADAREPRS